MRKILAYFARRSHNVQVQVLLAGLHGLLSVFGVKGTIAIILKMRKMNHKKVVRK